MEDISKMANKQDLIAEVAAKTGLTKKDSEKAVNAFGEVVTEFLAKGEKVQLIGFGTFEAKVRNARKGLNPKTREEILIPEATAPVFKAGKDFKELVNK